MTACEIVVRFLAPLHVFFSDRRRFLPLLVLPTPPPVSLIVCLEESRSLSDIDSFRFVSPVLTSRREVGVSLGGACLHWICRTAPVNFPLCGSVRFSPSRHSTGLSDVFFAPSWFSSFGRSSAQRIANLSRLLSLHCSKYLGV